jgi:hypothetical protein
MQTKEWKLATVTDVIDKDIKLDTFTNKAVLVKVENNLEVVCKRQRTLRKQYLDIVQDATDLEVVFNKVIKQLVTIKL